MKYLIFLFFALPLMAQDFESMYQHIDKYANPKCANCDTAYANGATHEQYVERKKEALQLEFYRIYREEYLRFVARELLDKRFSKTVEIDTSWLKWEHEIRMDSLFYKPYLKALEE